MKDILQPYQESIDSTGIYDVDFIVTSKTRNPLIVGSKKNLKREEINDELLKSMLKMLMIESEKKILHPDDVRISVTFDRPKSDDDTFYENRIRKSHTVSFESLRNLPNELDKGKSLLRLLFGYVMDEVLERDIFQIARRLHAKYDY